MEVITSIVYETRGRAREYCELAANLYRGCGHCCSYCYAPLAIKMDVVQFCNPQVREDVIRKIEKDAIELKNKGEDRPILMSFTTDPYQPLDVTEKLTRKAIKILHDNNLKVSILTKGGKRSERDFDLLSKNPQLSEYGTTLVFTDESWTKKIEPFAASTEERINSLKKAHDLGIYTYVSLEPVWFPNQSLELIDITERFVDLYKVGKLNYYNQQNKVDWHKFVNDVKEKLDSYNKKYYIKYDLKKFI
jgi:DNA repair photolyase